MQVALGANGVWVALWSDGSRSWNLADKYPDLANSGILGSEDRDIVFIALDGHHPNHYFLVDSTGKTTYSINMDSDEDLRYVDKMTTDYMQKRAREDGTRFEISFTHKGVAKSFHIDSESNFDFQWPKSSSKMASIGIRKVEQWTGLSLNDKRMLVRRDTFVMGAAALGAAATLKAIGLSNMRALLVGGAAAGGAGIALMWAKQ